MKRDIRNDVACQKTGVPQRVGLRPGFKWHTAESVSPFASRVAAAIGAVAALLLLMNTPNAPAQEIPNGDFSKGLGGWTVTLPQAVNGTAEVVPDGWEGKPALKVAIGDTTADFWEARMQRGDVSLEAGQSYTVAFFAKAEPGPFYVPLSVRAMTAHKDQAAAQNFELTPDWQEFQFSFTAEETDANSRFTWGHLAKSNGVFYFANIRISKD